MSTNRKGSLELGINAIVVLILAITMLGLGLWFLNSLFRSTAGQVSEITEKLEARIIEDLQASNERIALDRTKIKVSPDGGADFYIGLRNNLGDPAGAEFSIFTTGESATGATPTLIKSTGQFDIAKASGGVIQCYDTGSPGDISFVVQGTTGAEGTTVKHLIKYLPDNEIVIIPVRLKVSSGVKKGTTYSCAVIATYEVSDVITQYYRKEFFVEVQ